MENDYRKQIYIRENEVGIRVEAASSLRASRPFVSGKLLVQHLTRKACEAKLRIRVHTPFGATKRRCNEAAASVCCFAGAASASWASLGQSELHTRVNCADVIEKKWRLRHLQDVAIAGSGKLHPERLVNGEVSDVHVFSWPVSFKQRFYSCVSHQ